MNTFVIVLNGSMKSLSCLKVTIFNKICKKLTPHIKRRNLRPSPRIGQRLGLSVIQAMLMLVIQSRTTVGGHIFIRCNTIFYTNDSKFELA